MLNLSKQIVENVKEQLKNNGYKLTPQRRAILLTIIDNEGKHLIAEEIYDLVKEECPEIGLATVYRTLQIFEELNIVSRLELDDGCGRYELIHDDENHQHHHLICTNCGKVMEVQEDLLENLEEKIQYKYKFKIKNHSVKFYGLCESCSKNLKKQT